MCIGKNIEKEFLPGTTGQVIFSSCISGCKNMWANQLLGQISNIKAIDIEVSRLAIVCSFLFLQLLA